MIERLLSCANLMCVDLMSDKEYNDILDMLFDQKPEDDFLLDLEFVSADMSKTISIIEIYCTEHVIDYVVFGQFLMEGLKKAYSKYSMDITEFADKVYKLWSVLPSSIQSIEPFYTMCYADDPLSWGDTEQTRMLYEKMFHFFDEDKTFHSEEKR